MTASSRRPTSIKTRATAAAEAAASPEREPRNQALNALDRVARSFARISSPEPSRLYQLDDSLEQYDALNELELRTGVRKAHWAILAAAFAMAFIFFGFGSSTLCEWIGFLYPMYASFKCLDEPVQDRHSITAWLIYWVVFVVYQSNEFIADSILSRFPFYYPLKVVFVMWCLLPAYRGSAILYQAAIVPIGSRLQTQLAQVRREVGDVARACIVHACLHLRAASDAIVRRYPQIGSILHNQTMK